MEASNEEKYLNALREIETHIRSTPEPIHHIIKTLLGALPEYQVNQEDIENWIS